MTRLVAVVVVVVVVVCVCVVCVCGVCVCVWCACILRCFSSFVVECAHFVFTFLPAPPPWDGLGDYPQALQQKAGDVAQLSSSSTTAEAEADLRREAARAAEAALLAERRQSSMMRRDVRALTEVGGLAMYSRPVLCIACYFVHVHLPLALVLLLCVSWLCCWYGFGWVAHATLDHQKVARLEIQVETSRRQVQSVTQERNSTVEDLQRQLEEAKSAVRSDRSSALEARLRTMAESVVTNQGRIDELRSEKVCALGWVFECVGASECMVSIKAQGLCHCTPPFFSFFRLAC